MIKQDENEPTVFGKYASFSSPFITPQNPFSIEENPPSFTKKIFRHIQCKKIFEFPQFTEEETLDQLFEIETKYGKDEVEKKIKNKRRKSFRKRKKIILATDLILESKFSFGTIAMEVGLKKNDVKNLKKRLEKNGNILPKKIIKIK